MTLEGNLPLAVVAEVERLAMLAWPGLETVALDGWLLRHAAGVTRRANSVWPNEAHAAIDVEASLAQIEAFYHARNLPARFQICPAALPTELDGQLAARGYQAVARTSVQTTTLVDLLASLGEPSEWQVVVSDQASDPWWHCYAAADDVAVEQVAVRQAICAKISLATAYAIVVHGGEVVAVGSAAAGDDWVGFFNIATLPHFRRRGAARSLMGALAQWGQGIGATRAYLQVMAGNENALRLYERLSFTTGYFYHYREESRK